MILTALHKLVAQEDGFTSKEKVYLGRYQKMMSKHFEMSAVTKEIAPISGEEKTKNKIDELGNYIENSDIGSFEKSLDYIVNPKQENSVKFSGLHDVFYSLFEDGHEEFLGKFVEVVDRYHTGAEIKQSLMLSEGNKYILPLRLIRSDNTSGLQKYFDIMETFTDGENQVRELLCAELEYHSIRPNKKTYDCLKQAMDSVSPEMVHFLINSAQDYSTPEQSIVHDMMMHHVEYFPYYYGTKSVSLDAIIMHEDLLPEDQRPSVILSKELKEKLVHFASECDVESITWLRGFIERHVENSQKTLQTLISDSVDTLFEGLDGRNASWFEYDGRLSDEQQIGVIEALLVFADGFDDIQKSIAQNVPMELLTNTYFFGKNPEFLAKLDEHLNFDKMFGDMLDDLDVFFKTTSLGSSAYDDSARDKLFKLAQDNNKLDKLVEYLVHEKDPQATHSAGFALKLNECGYKDHAKEVFRRGDFDDYHRVLNTFYGNVSEGYKGNIDFFVDAAEKIGGLELAQEMFFSREGNALRGIKTAASGLGTWHDRTQKDKDSIHKKINLALESLVNKAEELQGAEGVHSLLLGSKRHYVKWHSPNHAEYAEKIREDFKGLEDDPGMSDPDWGFLKELQKWHPDSALDVLAKHFAALSDEEFKEIFNDDDSFSSTSYKRLAGGGRIKDLRQMIGMLSEGKQQILLELCSGFMDDTLLKTLIENSDREFVDDKEEQLFYKNLYINSGEGNERWQFLAGMNAPHKDLEKLSPFGFYGPKVKLYEQLLPLTQTAQKLERNSGAEEFAYKFAVLFRNARQVEQYLDIYAKRWNHSKSKQIVHDAALFNLPRHGAWTPNKWGDIIAQYGPRSSKYLAQAPKIEAYIEEHGMKFSSKKTDVYMKKHGLELSSTEMKDYIAEHGGDFPSKLQELVEASAKLTYRDAHKNINLAMLAKEHGIDESGFDEALRILDKAEKSSHLPSIFIDGADIGHSDYYMRKLAGGDHIGLVLGSLTNCCQNVGGMGGECAEHGMTSKFGGFYVWQKKTKGKITPKDTFVAQSWAWIGKDDKLVLDSFERLSSDYNILSKNFLEQLAFDIVGEHEFFVEIGENGSSKVEEHVISGVRLGGGGNSPDDIFSEEASALSEPCDTSAYDAYKIQYEIEPIDHSPELDFDIGLEEPAADSCACG